MFSDAFGKKNFLRDERHGAGVGASVSWAEKKICCCGKVTRRFYSVNAFEAEIRFRASRNSASGSTQL
jgi:hypothetical protein